MLKIIFCVCPTFLKTFLLSQLSFSVPDTSDVKETFGTVIDTVVEQENELVKLHDALDLSVNENIAARKKIVESTNQNMNKLMKHLLMIENQLKDSQKKLQNFSYNMLGFTDVTEEQEIQIGHEMNVIKDISIELQDTPPQTHDPLGNNLLSFCYISPTIVILT